jgi:hypothetical protein
MFSENLQGGFLQKIKFKVLKVRLLPLVTLPTVEELERTVDICNFGQINTEPLSQYNLLSSSGINQVGYSKEVKINNVLLLNSNV